MNPRTSRLATLTTASLLFAATVAAPHPASAQTHTASPCTLLDPGQLKTILGTPVLLGQPGPDECTWRDAKGETRVYLSLKDATDFKTFHDAMQATGRLVPITGLAEDAFFISSTGTSAALYALRARRLLLITVDGVGFTKPQNESAKRSSPSQPSQKSRLPPNQCNFSTPQVHT